MSLDFTLRSPSGSEVYSGNITHNLTPMASFCGVYQCLWRPDENLFQSAGSIIPPLTSGIIFLLSRYDECVPLNPQNGWGNADNLLHFCVDVWVACKHNPDATIEVWR